MNEVLKELIVCILILWGSNSLIAIAFVGGARAPLTWRVLTPWPPMIFDYVGQYNNEGFFSKFPWSRKSKRWQSKRVNIDTIKADGTTTINGLLVTYADRGKTRAIVNLNHSYFNLHLPLRHGYVKKKDFLKEWDKWVRIEKNIRPQTFNAQPTLKLEGVKVTPPKPEKEVEGAVRLWRIWRHRGGVLYPLTNTKAWCPGENRCDQYPGRGSNSAGFYGFFDLREIKRQEHGAMESARLGNYEDDYNSAGSYTFVIGSFLGYGRILEGTLGCRVEYAMPEYLILPDRNDDYAIELMTLADKHGMRPITVEQALTLKAGLVPWVKKGVRHD